MIKLKFKSDFLKSSNKFIFYNFFYNFFFLKCLKPYQLNIIKEIKKDYKKAPERYPNLSKEEKEKSNNMVVNVTKISQKMKSKS